MCMNEMAMENVRQHHFLQPAGEMMKIDFSKVAILQMTQRSVVKYCKGHKLVTVHVD
jgi:hypothetical protein